MNRPGEPEPDPLDGLDLDEDFIRGATQKEASARARMLSARWKQTPPVDPGGRRQRPGPAPGKRRRRRPPAVVVVTLTVVLVLLGLNAGGIVHWARGGGPARPSASGSPPATATAVALGLPTLQHPFIGSRSASWADNADGIVLPVARPVGGLSEAAVTEDLDRVKLYLIVAYLDPPLLAGGSAQPVLQMLDSRNSSWLSSALADPTRTDTATSWVSRFNPSYARPIGSVVKVRGTMTTAPDGHGGMTVRADYSFVYPTRQAPNGDVVSRVLARRVVTLDFYDPSRFQVEPGKLYVTGVDGDTANDRCDRIDGYLNPAFPAAPGPRVTGSAVDPYDTTQPVPSGTQCTPAQAP